MVCIDTSIEIIHFYFLDKVGVLARLAPPLQPLEPIYSKN